MPELIEFSGLGGRREREYKTTRRSPLSGVGKSKCASRRGVGYADYRKPYTMPYTVPEGSGSGPMQPVRSFFGMGRTGGRGSSSLNRARAMMRSGKYVAALHLAGLAYKSGNAAVKKQAMAIKDNIERQGMAGLI